MEQNITNKKVQALIALRKVLVNVIIKCEETELEVRGSNIEQLEVQLMDI